MPTQNTKKLLLTAAIDLFFQKGYSDTSIREIGEMGGISTSLIYHYFENKEEVLFEIIRNASVDIIKMLQEIEGKVTDPVECLWEMLTMNMILFSIERKKEFKIVAYERYWLKGDRREIIRKMQREIWDIYFKKVKAIAEAKLLNDIDLRVMNFCISTILLTFLNWYREDGILSGEEVTQNIVKFVFNAILNRKENYRSLMDRPVNPRGVNINLEE